MESGRGPGAPATGGLRRRPWLASALRVLVCSRVDPASVNLRDRILETGDWEATNRRFRDAPVWAQSEAVLVEIEGPSIHDEALDADLQSLGLPLRDVWFLSKHRAASGTPSLTVHPIGNHGEAKFGGQPRTLSPAAARDMGALLRRIRHHRDVAGLPHQVTYESTHHGPLMRLPSLFVEIGSDETWYSDPGSAQAVARAVQEVLRGEGKSSGPVVVGVGGGHYVPRQTDVALAGEADFGHFVPQHAVEAEGADAGVLRRAVEATPDCAGAYLYKKGLTGTQRQTVTRWCEELGVPLWSRPAAEPG
jgi:D-aminoacyl-tRNA deacylase